MSVTCRVNTLPGCKDPKDQKNQNNQKGQKDKEGQDIQMKHVPANRHVPRSSTEANGQDVAIKLTLTGKWVSCRLCQRTPRHEETEGEVLTKEPGWRCLVHANQKGSCDFYGSWCLASRVIESWGKQGRKKAKGESRKVGKSESQKVNGKRTGV